MLTAVPLCLPTQATGATVAAVLLARIVAATLLLLVLVVLLVVLLVAVLLHLLRLRLSALQQVKGLGVKCVCGGGGEGSREGAGAETLPSSNKTGMHVQSNTCQLHPRYRALTS